MMEMIVVKKKRQIIKDYMMYFFIYAVLGWILETIYAIICGNPEKRGFLYGPLCPIYGFGAIGIILLFKNRRETGIKENIKKFLMIIILLSGAEYLVSYGAEVLFRIRLWDYSTEVGNIAGRICILFSIVWGIGGIIFSNYIHPFLEKHILKTTAKIQNIFLIVVCSIFVIDFILSIIKYLS